MMVVFVALLLSLLCICSAHGQERYVYEGILKNDLPYPLPELHFTYEALEPEIDSATVRVHHSGHHKAYTGCMNRALTEWRTEDPESELARSSIVDILEHITEVPSNYQTPIRNCGGGYVNHIFYWTTLCPSYYSDAEPEGELREDIEASFGNMTNFLGNFFSAATQLFGSGYAWLVEDKEGHLSVDSTVNQDSPLSNGHYPLLVIDVWEHAYYLKHQNMRSSYLANWLNLICWGEVQQLRHFWREAGKIPKKKRKTEL